jgi:hypothetical protein
MRDEGGSVAFSGRLVCLIALADMALWPGVYPAFWPCSMLLCVVDVVVGVEHVLLTLPHFYVCVYQAIFRVFPFFLYDTIPRYYFIPSLLTNHTVGVNQYRWASRSIDELRTPAVKFDYVVDVRGCNVCID